ncbi:MAG: adenylyl-sulfate kinase, partial [Myxococcota bacterium]
MHTLAQGTLILLTGLSGAGKTTLGYHLTQHLREFGTRPVYFLDGDVARNFFGRDLGYSPAERDRASKRMAFGAMLLVHNNIDVVMANIAGSRQTRAFFREKFLNYIEIYLDVDIEVLIEKDIKGIYAKALSLDHPQLVGYDLPYDVPDAPDLVVYPHQDTLEESLQQIVAHLVQRGPTLGTKADTLESLAGYIQTGVLLPQLTINHTTFEADPSHHVRYIRDRLLCDRVMVRSSCSQEDGQSGSNAGRFESVRDVEIALAPLREAIARVVASYHAGGEPSPDKAQILIQPMLSHVSSSGVVFTRYQHTDSPYYTIAYDDITGTTDTVTGGRGGQTLFISRTLPENRHPPRWKRLLNVIRELETYFPNHPLDIEFAITQDERIVILQCRRLAMPPIERSLEQSAAEMLQELELRFERCQAPQPPLQGSTTILSDMADWNPAEMLGEKPNTLAYSLYRELITDHVWHQARSSLGYFDVGAASLMLSFARKSYIDTRASFNSLTPAAIQPETRSILLEHYLNKLRNDPTLHDKVEFEILHTCYDLTVRQRLDEVEGLSPAQREEVAQSLLELTHTLVDQEVVAADLRRLDQLDERIDAVHQVYRSRQAFWECFNAAFLLLGH